MSSSSSDLRNTATKCTLAGALLCLGFMLLAGSVMLPSYAQTALAAADRYEASQSAFSRARIDSLVAHHYKVPSHMEFKVPNIMLFSPDGEMVAQATDGSSLAELERRMPPRADGTSLAGDSPDWHWPEWVVFQDVLIKAAGAKVEALDPRKKNQWTLFLISSNFDGCNHCASFDKAFGHMRKNNSAQVHAISLSLTMN